MKTTLKYTGVMGLIRELKQADFIEQDREDVAGTVFRYTELRNPKNTICYRFTRHAEGDRYTVECVTRKGHAITK